MTFFEAIIFKKSIYFYLYIHSQSFLGRLLSGAKPLTFLKKGNQVKEGIECTTRGEDRYESLLQASLQERIYGFSSLSISTLYFPRSIGTIEKFVMPPWERYIFTPRNMRCRIVLPASWCLSCKSLSLFPFRWSSSPGYRAQSLSLAGRKDCPLFYLLIYSPAPLL